MSNSIIKKSLINFVAISVFSFAAQLQADVVGLDNEFGTAGHMPYANGAGSSISNIAVEVVAQGKVITLSSYDSAGLIIRHLEDGTPDYSFAGSGSIFVNDTLLTDLAMQTDGKIVVVGKANISASNNDLLIARYSEDGTPDYSFGNNGITIIPDQPDMTSGVPKVGIQSDGRVVIAAGSGDIVVARLTDKGVPDLTFGYLNTFKVVTDFGGRYELGQEMTIDDQDRILVSGASWPKTGSGESYDNRAIVVRYSASGQLDTSFKDKQIFGGLYLCDYVQDCGKQYIFPEDYANPHQYPKQILVIKSNGDNLQGNKILLTGNFGTARLNENGTFDKTFANNGYIGSLIGDSVAVKNDDKIMLLRRNNKIEILKDNGQLEDDVINYNCTLDSSVDITIPDYTVKSLSNLKIDHNDRLIISGNGHDATDENFNTAFLARYTYTGCPMNYKDFQSVNPFVHPQDIVGPIWGGLNQTIMK